MSPEPGGTHEKVGFWLPFTRHLAPGCITLGTGLYNTWHRALGCITLGTGRPNSFDMRLTHLQSYTDMQLIFKFSIFSGTCTALIFRKSFGVPPPLSRLWHALPPGGTCQVAGCYPTMRYTPHHGMLYHIAACPTHTTW